MKRIHDVAENDGDCVDDDEQLGSFFKVFGSEQRFGGLGCY